jgi:mRNA interferase RelE/StbE
MSIKFRKEASKFLDKASFEDVTRIGNKINQLLISIEEEKTIPFTELNIKKMRGNWEGFYRIRIGKIRIVFTADIDSTEVVVYTIGVRGDVYK